MDLAWIGESQSSIRKPRVLCLITSSRLESAISRSPTLTSGRYLVYNFKSEVAKCKRQGRLDMNELCQRAVEFVQKNSIDIVLALSDDMTLLQGALSERFPSKVRGPTLESSFVAMHKYYTRELIDPNAIPFCHIDLDSPLTEGELRSKAATVGFPAFLKPSLGTYSVLGKKVNSLEELVGAMENARKHYGNFINEFIPFFAHYLDVDKFPLALKRSMILEKYIDVLLSGSVDGYICGRKIIHWAIGDWIRWPTETEVLQQGMLPSALPDEMQAKIWQAYDTLAHRLIEFGYDDQFLNMEFFLCKDGEVRLMEVNPRMDSILPSYLAVMKPGPLGILLDVLEGKEPPSTVEFTGKHASMVLLVTLAPGKVSDIIDLDVAKSLKHLTLDVEVDREVDVVSDTGTYLGHTWLFGESREELLKKHQQLYAVLFKRDPIQRQASATRAMDN